MRVNRAISARIVSGVTMNLSHQMSAIAQRFPGLVGRGSDAKSWRRSLMCLIGAVLSVALVWVSAAAYLVLTPRAYVTRWTLIIPGAGQNTTFQLDTVGQTTSSANSPYASVTLNPKTVYKEIAVSENVRWAAAQKLGMSFNDFGSPRVKLIDETSLMLFEISGRTAEDSHRKALALMEVFEKQLDTLRADELAKRSAAVTTNLQAYKAQVDLARQRITDIQVQTGLVSINQFNELVANLAAARRKLTELTGDVDRLREEQSKLTGRLGIDPSQASIALRLASDPTWLKVISEYSDANGMHASEARRLGPANPVLVAIANRRDGARAQLRKLLAGLGVDVDDSKAFVLVANLSQQAELLKQLVRNEALLSGKSEEFKSIISEKDRLEDEIGRLSSAAAKLEDLRKEQLLAEAVYSSALARVDTSKSDIHGAYPIVQTVEAPSKPDGHRQPRRIYALSGGAAGTIFSCLVWGLLWLSMQQSEKRRKKRSSTV
jgi:capsule polysaccharide export protein KpsE/RkpR